MGNHNIDLEIIKEIIELLQASSEVIKYEIGLCINKENEDEKKEAIFSLAYFKKNTSIGKKIYSSSLSTLLERIKTLLTEKGGKNDNQS